MIRKCMLTLVLLMTVLVAGAQEKKKFSPEKFNEAMEEFIQKKAELTQQEADKVFPILREMHKKHGQEQACRRSWLRGSHRGV